MARKYTLYESGGKHYVEDAVNPANYSKQLSSLAGTTKKQRSELIEFRSTTLSDKHLKKLQFY